MTSIMDISEDTLKIVFAILTTVGDQIAFRETSITFCDSSDLMKIKIGRMNFKYPLLSSTHVFHRRSCLCVNVDCGLARLLQRSRAPEGQSSMGMTIFYYPKELCPPHDYEGDPWGLNREFSYRENACHDAVQIKRYIPYCTMCMMEFVNFGERTDELEVPYRNRQGDSNW